MEPLAAFPFSRSHTLTVGEQYRFLLSEHSVRPHNVRPQQQWRARFVGPALVAASLSWSDANGGFEVEFTLPLPGPYTAELLLEYDDTRLDSANTRCLQGGGLGHCYKTGLLPGHPAGATWDPLRNTSLGCKEAADEDRTACAPLTDLRCSAVFVGRTVHPVEQCLRLAHALPAPCPRLACALLTPCYARDRALIAP